MRDSLPHLGRVIKRIDRIDPIDLQAQGTMRVCNQLTRAFRRWRDTLSSAWRCPANSVSNILRLVQQAQYPQSSWYPARLSDCGWRQICLKTMVHHFCCVYNNSKNQAVKRDQARRRLSVDEFWQFWIFYIRLAILPLPSKSKERGDIILPMLSRL